ncbi:MAG: NAD(P)-dependent oxidoreductase [Sphaerochaeta sp.]|uniref:NAD(P)-dependent oxidoreductase n=1 Tax=Sphaerochaeta sp. TaxID=1972642 RepID=UPI001D474B0F|nr:NAD(P)-dependent oxidoreductase [Sphaerochaeta sp.]MDD3928866.1 NAD(P)-dependent oxidoreductase [Sphaerochaeta sp.]NCC12079.1 hydroxyacid dehydrogenase [Spirochaetia bacterium]NCC90036.1 hydroxyacid dehydrogenase [Spirochaetia bacterium]
MLILISDAFDSSLPERLSVFGEVTSDKNRLSEAEVVLVRSKTKCTKEYIDQAPKLKLIIRGGVGIDNIDKVYAESKGIIVRNTPKSSAIAVAELAFSLMLSTPNNLVAYHNGMKQGEWLKNLKRTELYGKTLCLFGIGNIASKVAERAKAFGMKVVAFDKYVSSSPVAEMVATPELAVADADYISLHLPLTDETRGMVNKALISHCKKSPVVINTGRGLCVDADDMVSMLSEGSVSWYCTDVYPSDPPSPDYPILGCERVTLTPHVGANSEENLARIGEETFDIIDELKKGGKI